jgi:hypothetical protein
MATCRHHPALPVPEAALQDLEFTLKALPTDMGLGLLVNIPYQACSGRGALEYNPRARGSDKPRTVMTWLAIERLLNLFAVHMIGPLLTVKSSLIAARVNIECRPSSDGANRRRRVCHARLGAAGACYYR